MSLELIYSENAKLLVELQLDQPESWKRLQRHTEPN